MRYNDVFGFSRNYKLDDNRNPVPCTMLDLALWEGSGEEKRRVAWTEVGDRQVSTVFLGLEHGWRDGKPVLFETMVRTAGKWDDQRRYCTWDEAVAGHEEKVAELRAETN